ncbi:MAG: 30S ribosomal protein S16 [Melioribacteraceae bacterium]|nr:30S ribosomal protein S16 [Melioribacteraceae bacterium]
MAVKLRLRRMGKKRQPVYKVVAADVRSPRDGKFIEAIGLYNPKTNPAQIDINEERALYWLGVGAEPTDTVRNLLSKSGILLKRELLKEGLDEEKISARMEEWNSGKEEKLAAAQKKAEEKLKAEEKKKAAQEAAKAEAEKEVSVTTENEEATGTASEEGTAEEKA